MKESCWGYWLILLGVFVMVVLLLVQDATTTNSQDYYLLKEVANSAIYDAVDYSYYAQTGQIRIMKEIFVENFLRRFAQTVSLTDTYQIDFYDLYESPPKVSIKIATTTAGFVVGRDSSNVDPNEAVTQLDVVNSIDLIVEFDNNVPASPSNCGVECEREYTGCTYYPIEE